MVTRKRLRSFLTTLGLYVGVALLIGYFGVNAYTGNHGLRAKQDLDQQIAQLTVELSALKAERTNWDRRVSLLKSDSLDPDMLDERARSLLDYVDPRDHAAAKALTGPTPSAALVLVVNRMISGSVFPENPPSRGLPLRDCRLRFRPRMISAKGWMTNRLVEAASFEEPHGRRQ